MSGRQEKGSSNSRLEGLVASILQKNPQGLRSDEIAALLSGTSTDADVTAVHETLDRLRKAKTAHLTSARRWIPAKKDSAAPPRSERKQRPAAAAASSLGFGLDEQALLAVGVQIDVRREPDARRSTPESKTPDGKNWQLFRRLLEYYARALAADDRPDLISSWERAGERFVLLSPTERWWAERGEQISLRLKLASLPVKLRETLSTTKVDQLRLGYPLQIVRKRNSEEPPFIRPVASVAVTWRFDTEHLVLTERAQPIELSTEWLRWQRRKGRDVLRLLSSLGVGDDELSEVDLADSESDADDERPAEIAAPDLDFATLGESLYRYLPSECRQPLSAQMPLTRIPGLVDTGIYNSLGLFLAESSKYVARAIGELRALAKWEDGDLDRSALSSIVLGRTSQSVPSTAVVEPLPLGEEQLSAVRDAMCKSLTVITGPPGTGKTQVVAAILALQAANGRSTLFASKNHKALDAVETRLNNLAGERSIICRVSRPYGEGGSFRLDRAVDALLARPLHLGARERLVSELGAAATLDRRRCTHLNALDKWAIAEHSMATAVADRSSIELALDLLLQEASNEKTAKAITPLLGVLAKLLLHSQDSSIARLLARISAPAWMVRGLVFPHAATISVSDCLQRSVLEDKLIDARKREALAVREIEGLGDRETHANAVIDLTHQIRSRGSSLVPLLPDALSEIDADYRGELAMLRGEVSLSAMQDPRRRRALWARFGSLVLRQFPLWATTSLSAGRDLPLTPALFDCVVIDEASQGDIASALPLLARSRRAVIVGDPAQLHHSTSVSSGWEAEVLRGLKILNHPEIGRFTYTTNSLFALAASSKPAVRHLLRDHFRCHGDIADYISATFYGQQLRIMTDPTKLRPPAGMKPGLHWTHAPGSVVSATGGGCHAPEEAEAIVKHLADLLVVQGYQGTIGVATPFREQASRLNDLIAERLPSEASHKANLRAFTAHRFQGDERDVILVSLCANTAMPSGSLSFLRDTGNLINVAVSRARAVCHVFGDQEFALSCGISHISRLATRALRSSIPQAPTDLTFESPWEERLYQAAVARGLSPVPQYPLAGRRLDLALTREKIDVEVDGDRYHRDASGERKTTDLWRDHQIRGLGWRVMRFWVYQLREDMDGCVDRIVDAARTSHKS